MERGGSGIPGEPGAAVSSLVQGSGWSKQVTNWLGEPGQIISSSRLSLLTYKMGKYETIPHFSHIKTFKKTISKVNAEKSQTIDFGAERRQFVSAELNRVSVHFLLALPCLGFLHPGPGMMEHRFFSMF